MSAKPPVRVFIGSGEASVIERKVLIHSLRKTCSRELDLYVFNGTHNAVEHNDEPPVLANLPLSIKYRNYTEFSNYRFLIPEICGHQGRAIFLDSDMVCLADIAELFDQDMKDCDMLAKAEAYQGEGTWALSNILFDCSRCRFDLEQIFADVDRGVFSNTDFHQMTPKFLQSRHYQLGAMDPHWNVFDKHDLDTKLIHYTNLRMQPWKFANHPYEELWFKHFEEAKRSGFITPKDIDMALSRAYVRQDIQKPTKVKSAVAQSVQAVSSAPTLKPWKRLRNRLKSLLKGESKKAA
jgi:lipopolysaccharide biosynthesis glycosyltransferase